MHKTTGFFPHDTDQERLDARLREIDDALNDGYKVAFSAPIILNGKPYVVVYLHKWSGVIEPDVTAGLSLSMFDARIISK